MITLKNINKSIGSNRIFQSLSLTFPDQGLFFLTGDNGCGKTTLLYLLALLDSDYEGEYWIDKKETNLLNRKEKEILRKEKISLLLPKGNLLDFLTIRENVHLFCKTPKEFLKAEDRSIKGLSGGEEILYALSNEIGKNKDILLLDEITASLSKENVDRVMDILVDYAKGHLVIMACHDVRVLSRGQKIEMTNATYFPYSLEDQD